MALKKVTGLWFKTAQDGSRYFDIKLGVMGKHVLIARRDAWELCYLAEDGPVVLAKLEVKKSEAGQRYLVLPLGDAGKFVLFENNKLSDSSPDWTMNREVGELRSPDNTPVTATSIPY